MKAMKKLLAIMLSLAMAITYLPANVIAFGDGETPEPIAATIEYQDWEATDSLPSAGNYKLTDNVTVTNLVNLTGDLNLDLNGYTITRTTNCWGVLRVNRGTSYNLYITNSSEEEAVITGTQADTTNPLIGSLGAAGGTEGAGGSITLENITLKGVDGAGPGAVITVQGTTTLTVNNCKFEENNAKKEGIIYLGSTGAATFNDCQIEGPVCEKDGSTCQGSVFTLHATTTLTLNNTKLTGNLSEGVNADNGGAIYGASGATITLGEGTEISGFKALKGGAVYIASGTLNIEDGAVISNNIANGDTSGYQGGAVYSANSAVINVKTGATVTGNKAFNGGAFALTANSTLNVTGGTISNNTAKNSAGKSGAGGAVYADGSSKINISDGTFTGNEGVYGGVIRRAADTTVFNITGGTFKNNKAFDGGVFFTASGIGCNIDGGTYTGNTATDQGGFCYIQGTLTITGAPVIRDNKATVKFDDVYTNVTNAEKEDSQPGKVVLSEITDGAYITLSVDKTVYDALKADPTSSRVIATADGDYSANVFADEPFYYATSYEEGKLSYSYSDQTHVDPEDDKIVYKPWNISASANYKTTLPTSGNYYLTEDVSKTGETQVKTGNTLNLDLNGHVISCNSLHGIKGLYNSTINITDSSAVITNGKFVSGGKITGGLSTNYGALYCDGAKISVKNIEICNCGSTQTPAAASSSTKGFGGGIASIRSRNVGGTDYKGSFTMTSCYVHDNTSASEGGALSIPNGAKKTDSYYGSETTTVCTNVVFENNTAATKGGAVYIPAQANSVTFTGCEFINNTANGTTDPACAGGAIAAESAASTLTVDSCTFTGNTAKNGSALRVNGSVNFLLKDSTVKNNVDMNTGQNYAGAVYIIGSDPAKIVFEGSNYITGNKFYKDSTGALADTEANINPQNTTTQFTLKNATSDTYLKINGNVNNYTVDRVLGKIEGELKGVLIDSAWRKCVEVDTDGETLIVSEHIVDGVLYKPWTSTTTLPVGNPTDKSGGELIYGGYYLINDVTVKATYRPTTDLNLDLNGYTITKDAAVNGAMGLASAANLSIISTRGQGQFVDATDASTTWLFGSTAAATGDIYIENIKFTGVNGTGDGACLCIQGSSVTTFKNCEFSDNITKSGPLYIGATSTVTVDGCTFKDNTSTASGGAISLRKNEGKLVVTGSAFTGNAAANGGALWLMPGSKVEIHNSTIKNNSATTNGGAILHNDGSGDVTGGTLLLDGVDIEDNTCANQGEGIWFNSATVTLEGKNIIKNNLCTKDESTKDISLRHAAKGTIVIGETFDAESEISVYQATATEGAVIATGATSDVSDCFTVTNTENSAAYYDENDSTIKYAGHIHDGIRYTAWTDGTKFPTTEGNYYLSKDVTLTTNNQYTGTVNVCLNGHTVTLSGKPANEGYIRPLADGAIMNITNDSEEGGFVYESGSSRNVFFANVEAELHVSNIKVSGYQGSSQMITAQTGSTFTFDNCAFVDCAQTASNNSGLIYNDASTINFTECAFNNLKANYKNAEGASTLVYSAPILLKTADSVVTMDDCLVMNCSSNSGDDTVACVAVRKGTFTATNSTFEGNTSAYQGIIYVNNDNTAIADIDGCTFTENTGKNASVVYVGTAGHLYLKDSTVTDNHSVATSGGAIYLLSQVTDSTTFDVAAARNVLEGANVIKDNTGGTNNTPCNLMLQNVKTVFTLKNPTADTEIYFRSAANRDMTIGTLDGEELLGTYVYDTNPQLAVKAEDDKNLVLYYPDIVYEGVTYQPWTETTSLPAANADGKGYYLTGNVTLADIHRVTGSLDLLLNGHEIKLTKANAYGAIRTDGATAAGSVINIVNNSENGGFNGAGAADRTGNLVFANAATPSDVVLNVKNVNFYGVTGNSSGNTVTINTIHAYFTDCRFTDNTVKSDGAGLYIAGGANVTLNGCEFGNNKGNSDIQVNDATLNLDGTNVVPKLFIIADTDTKTATVNYTNLTADTTVGISGSKNRNDFGTVTGDFLGTFTYVGDPRELVLDAENKLVFKTYEDIVYEGVTYQPWTKGTTLPNQNSDDKGYYLVGDVTLTAANPTKGDLDLLLDGHEIRFNTLSAYGAVRIDQNTPEGTVVNIVNNKEEGGFNGQGLNRVGALLFSNGTATASTFNVKNVAFYGADSDAAVKSGHMVTIQGAVSATFTDCTFHDNQALDSGNSIYFTSTGSLDLVDCTFENNTANIEIPTFGPEEEVVVPSTIAGGAVYVGSTAGAILVDGCTFAGNESNAGSPALVIMGHDSENRVIDSTFENNEGCFGAVRVSAASVVELSGNTFIDNSIAYDEIFAKRMTNTYTSGKDIFVVDNSSTAEITNDIRIGDNEFVTSDTTYPSINVGKRERATICGALIYNGEGTLIAGQERSEIYMEGADITVPDGAEALHTYGTLFLDDTEITGNVTVDAKYNMWQIQMNAMVIASGDTVADITLTENTESAYAAAGGEAEKAILAIQGAPLTENAEITVTIPDGGDINDFVFGPANIEKSGDAYVVTEGVILPGGGEVVIDEETGETYAFTSASLTIADDLELNFYVESTDEEATVKFVVDGEECTDVIKNEDGSWTILGITPRMMTTPITATICSADGTEMKTVEYSVVKYAESLYQMIANKTDTKSEALKALLADMLTFGKESVALDLEASKGIDPTEGLDWVETYKTEATKPADDLGVTGSLVTAAGINFTEATRIYFAFSKNATSVKLESSTDGLNWDTVVEGTPAQMLKDETLPVEMFRANGGIKIYTDKIMATENAKLYKITVSDGASTSVVTYSVNSYINAMWDDATVGGVVKTLNNYGTSAIAYAND